MPRGRAADYDRQEILNFLEIAARLKPISQSEWEGVLQEHNLTYAFKNRTTDSLKRKYCALHRKQVPTGDSTCPVEVRLAKRVRVAISQRAQSGDGTAEVTFPSGNDEDATDEENAEDLNDSPNDSSNSSNTVSINGDTANIHPNSVAAVGPGNLDDATSAVGPGNLDDATSTTNQGPPMVVASVLNATPSINRAIGWAEARLHVTPRGRASTARSNTPSNNTEIQDFFHMHMLQMQQDRERDRLMMEQQRLKM